MFIALLLAVTSVSCISIFTDRLQKALLLETQEFLGGDLKYESNEKLLPSVLKEINYDIFVKSEVTSFASMISAADNMQLSSVKAVDSFYPLIGHVELEDESSQGKQYLESPPPRNHVWIDKRLKELLEVEIGDFIEIGNANFIVSHTLISEPDRGSSSFAFAPKAIINVEDLPETNILQPGSRVRYTYLFLGEKEEILTLKDNLENTKKAGDQITVVGNNQASIGSAVKRSQNFFLLGGLLAVLLAAFTVGITSQRFVRRHVNYVAILRSLGASSFEVKTLYTLIFTQLAIASIVLGITFGWFIQNFFVSLLKDYFPTNLPDPGIEPLIISTFTVVICLGGFCLPYIVKLLNVSPIIILRKEGSNISFSSLIFTLMSLTAMFALLFLYTKDLLLSLIIFFSIIAISVIGISIVLIFLSRKSPEGLGADSPVKLAWSELHRRKYSNSFQIMAFTVAIGLSLIAFTMKTDLISSWEKSFPLESPNNFAINISESNLEPMSSFLSDNKIKINPFYPITNARLFKIYSEVEDKETNLPIDRTFNITWTYELPEKNKISSGKWFTKSSANGLSISEDIAERYALKIGDKIKLNLSDTSINTFIQSIRKVNWESFTPNFFVIGHPSLFNNTPSTFITSFYIPKNKETVASKFMNKFKTVSLLSIDALLKQITDIIEHVSKALQVILGLTIISSMLLTIGTMQDGFNLRLHQSAILRTLGAKTSFLQKATLMEFAFLGIFSGILAAVLAQVCLYFLESKIFEITPSFHYLIWIIGPLSGLLIISLISLILITSITNKSPKEILLNS